MIKRHKKSKAPLMRRTARIYLNDLNARKAERLKDFLYLCHDVTQYAVELFWQRRDFSSQLADLETVHRIRDRFGITTRLAQALAKQAKEIIRSAKANGFNRKPRLRRHTVTLYSHFVRLEAYHQAHFDHAAVLTGSGAPKGLTVPFHNSRLIRRRLKDGWRLDNTLRLGRTGKRLWLEVILVMERPKPYRWKRPRIVGMDSNYVSGFVFSDGQHVGQDIYDRIQTFAKRQKHTFKEISDLVGKALHQVNWSRLDVLVLERLRHVKTGRRGTFSRRFNRRLSHWLYKASEQRIRQYCEEWGIVVKQKNPWKTSQCCSRCLKWDRRSRKGERFACVFCGHEAHADFNAARNLAFLETVGVYGLGNLKNNNQSPKRHSCC